MSFIVGSLNIFRLWSESQHARAQCHKGVFDGKEREKKTKQVVLGQSIGYPFKPEHSTGRFSKCQSHFWLWTDSLMEHSVQCGRAMEEVEEKEEMGTKSKHKEKKCICN